MTKKTIPCLNRKERIKQSKNVRGMFENFLKPSIQTILDKYGLVIDPDRFSLAGTMRNFVTIEINYDRLKDIIADELSEAFNCKITLRCAPSSCQDELARLDLTQLLPANKEM